MNFYLTSFLCCCVHMHLCMSNCLLLINVLVKYLEMTCMVSFLFYFSMFCIDAVFKYMCEIAPYLVSSGLLIVALWFRYRCNFLNFARNTRCLKCKTEGPTKEANTSYNEVERKKGDWTCTQ